MMSLNMLIEFGDAFDYTGADFAGWCRDAGFARTEVIPLRGPASAAVPTDSSSHEPESHSLARATGSAVVFLLVRTSQGVPRWLPRPRLASPRRARS